ncbi:TRAP transporter small permease [Polycladidibacter hongkongensis]|uniref:TRAP transporter small permease n=1 Tax=Polycladidibacter hongkongensis TaxID=1647556 RepID=UPI00083023CC|nr:TRAP transporter small permease [Pseudovibrio hongkongensis]
MIKNCKFSLEGCVASLLFMFLICVIVLQVLGRTSLVEAPIWTEEASRWIWVWMALLGIGEVERTNGHLRMGFLADMLPTRVQWLLTLTIDLVYFYVAAQLLYYGYWQVQYSWYNEAVTLPFTDALMYAAFPVAFVFVVARIGMRIFRSLFTSQSKAAGE